ncbi:hypothetical protein [Streptomyces tritici]|uniref:hypothetical protein n=1 Tax=Streptomyces tritici TaxID=2054410 RepID=UPI003AEFE299
MPTTSPIPVLQGDQGTELRSRGDELVLRRPSEEVRIPLAAIQRVHANGRVVAVELTAPDGVESTLYRIEGVSRAAASAFADTVNVTLPERAEGEEEVDGSALVTVRGVEDAGAAEEEDEEEVRDSLWNVGKWTAYGAWVALLGFSVAVGIAGEHLGRAVAVLLMGSCAVGLGFAVLMALFAAWDNWFLPRYGITVEATEVWLDGRETYVYTDLDGRTHKFGGTPGEETVRVAYGPRRPRMAIACGQGWIRQVKDLTAVVFLAAFATPFTLGTYHLALPAFGG